MICFGVCLFSLNLSSSAFIFFFFVFFFFNYTATTDFYTYLHTLSLHAAIPIYLVFLTPKKNGVLIYCPTYRTLSDAMRLRDREPSVPDYDIMRNPVVNVFH